MTAGFTNATVLLRESFVGHAPYGMYVQTWTSGSLTARRREPLILTHGGAHTGVCWTTTPDGRVGWAQHFAARGWTTYVIDWPGVGRSGWAPDFLTMGPGPILDTLHDLLRRTGPAILNGHSIGAALSFKLVP